jgi:hypothetical protein
MVMCWAIQGSSERLQACRLAPKVRGMKVPPHTTFDRVLLVLAAVGFIALYAVLLSQKTSFHP